MSTPIASPVAPSAKRTTCTCGSSHFSWETVVNFKSRNSAEAIPSVRRGDCAECGKRWLFVWAPNEVQRIQFPSVEARKILEKLCP